jgi:two-component system sensor histidine kinase/response regulator
VPQLDILPHSFDVKDVIEERVDAMSGYSTDEPFELLKAGLDFMKFTPRSGGIDFYGDCLFTTEGQIHRYPERVKAFLKASLRGWDYALKHPEEIIDVILSRYPTKKTRDHLLFEAKQMRRLMEPELIEIGYMNPGRWRHIAETYSDLGMIHPDFSLNGLLYESKLDLKRLYWIIGALLALAFVLTAISVLIYRLNRRLQHQIKKREKTELALGESGREYRFLAKNVQDILWTVDMQMNMTYVSPSVETIVGFTPEEMKEQSISAQLTPEFLDRAQRILAEELENDKREGISPDRSVILSADFIRKDGATVCLETTVSFIRDKDSNPIGVYGLSRDITDRKRAWDALTKTTNTLQALLDNTSAIIFIKDLQGRYTLINREFERYFGVSKEEFLGKTDYDLFPDHIANVVRENDQQVIASKEALQFEEFSEFPDGMHFAISIKVPLHGPHGEPEAICGISTDITGRKKSEESLRETKNTLQAILDNTPAFIFVKDLDGRYILINREFERGFNLPAKEILGKTDHELFPKHIADVLRKTDLHVISSRKALQVEEPGEFPHGMEYGLSNKVPLYGPEGDLAGLCGITTVITERKRAVAALKESEQRLAQIIDFLPDATFVIDREGIVVAWNRAIEHMTGMSAEDMLGKGDYEYALPFYGKRRPILIDLVNTRDEATEAEYISITEREETLVSESFHPLLGSEGVYLSGTARPLYDSKGSPVGAIESIRDITERKKAEEALKVARATAESATRAKGDFLANMSHEIRTPMNAIMGMTNLALTLDVSPRLLDYLTKIRSSSESLLSIINDILDYSRIEAERLEPESVSLDIRQVVANTSDVVCAHEACQDVEFLVSIDPGVPHGLIGDPFRLEQVLTNLASNAVKFTPGGGEVLIKVDFVKAGQEEVDLEFSVGDTGIGIPEEKLGTLFNPFTQADGSTTRRFGGSGLGLTICNRLVNMMGGQIEIESEPGKGSLLSFKLTFQVQPRDQEHDILIPEDIRGKRVLVVDDNTTSRHILVEMLKSFSLTAVAVGSGEEALEELVAAGRTNPYDLVLLDWKMPGIDGIETARRIDRRDPLSGRIRKIIMITAFGTEEVRKQAEAAGVDALISKPVQSSFLLDTIMEIFGKVGPRVFRGAQARIREAMGCESIRGARILVAEDNRINQQVAKEILEYAGAAVQIAWNGREAVTVANESEFDAVLMDIQMPEMDGYEATRVIRSDDRLQDLPIIAMTAHAMAGDCEKSLKAGMNDHVTKPIDPKGLLNTLAKWVKPSMSSRLQPTVRACSSGSEVDQDPWQSMSGIHMESALQRLGGNEEVLGDLLAEFATYHADSVRELREALCCEDKEEALQLAHAIKGVAGNISANRLYQAASQLETAIGLGNTDDCGTCLKSFEKALDEVLQSIDTMTVETARADATETSAVDREHPPLDVAAVAPGLKELAALLEEGSVRSITLIHTIDPELSESSVREAWNQTCHYVRSYNFIDALRALEEVARRLNVQLR